MALKKVVNSLTDSSKVLLFVGVISLFLDLIGEGSLDKKLVSGLGMLMWLGIMVYQNQCLGPRDCTNYSWLLVILLVIGMLIKMYYVNISGLSRIEFKHMMEHPNRNYGEESLPLFPGDEGDDLNLVEGFGGCTGCAGCAECAKRNGEESCGNHEGFYGGCARRSVEEVGHDQEGFYGGCARRSAEEVGNDQEGFEGDLPLYPCAEGDKDCDDLVEGFDQINTST